MMTAAGFYLRYLVDALATLGLDVHDILAARGLSVATLSQPDARVGLDIVDDIVRAAQARDTAELPLSLRVGGAVTPMALDVLAYASMSSHTLREAIGLLETFERYRLGFARCEVHAGADAWVVELVADAAPVATLTWQVEAALAGWVGFGRWIKGLHADPLKVTFRHACPGRVQDYEAYFRCPVTFSSPRHAVYVDPAILTQPLATANPAVCGLMREALQRRLDHHARGDDFLAKLEQAVEAVLPLGTPDLAAVADALHVAPRQLRAQAQAAGTTLTQVVDAVRQRLARQWLSAGLPLADISQNLGYSEQSAFNRACVRWFGMSPGRWRQLEGGTTHPE
jgi:AraC-like DNA-binding protein